jgi:predicted HAD superfamily phosphohydrolase YqeG
MTKQIVVCFDCDGTLIDFFSRKPRYEMIALFHSFEKAGCKMYIWSHAGEAHACECRDRLGLKAQTIEKYSIYPDIAVDDEDRGIARVVIPA